MFGKAKSVVGLDIGSSAVKIVELRRTKNGYQLIKLGKMDLPPETIVDGALMNTSQVAEGIMQLIQVYNIKTKEVACSVSGHSVIIKKIQMPAMSQEELEEQIQWEAEQYIPFDINDVYIDVQIMNPGGDEAGQIDVILVAAKKDLVNDYTAVVAESGLTPTIMDVDAFAIENVFEANYEIVPGETVALINLGASVTNINILKEGLSTFTRDVSIGGNLYTEEIQKQLNVGYDEAEALKLGGVGQQENDAVVPQEVEGILAGVSENVIAEIQRSLDFFAATAPEDRISKLYLSGGTAKVPGLAEMMEEKVGISTDLLNPFLNMTYKAKDIDAAVMEELGPAASVGVGLALRFQGDKNT